MQAMKIRISCGDFSENLTAHKRRSYGVSHSEKPKIRITKRSRIASTNRICVIAKVTKLPILRYQRGIGFFVV